jgi:23S rRNA pseudouridine2605 synthase
MLPSLICLSLSQNITMAKNFRDKGKESGNTGRQTNKSKNQEKPSFSRYKNEKRPSDFNEKQSDSDSSERRRSYPFKKAPVKFKKTYSKSKTERAPSSAGSNKTQSGENLVRLNKYLSNAGICSRREADELIASGVVKVNGVVVTEMGYKIKPTDIVNYGGQTLKKERLVYLILNKPKDYITTYDDPEERRTVMQLIQGACKERVYPVGRLDRNTTGLLLFTNDGELTKRLTHPRYGVRKIYHVELDKPLKQAHLKEIEEGVELEDGIIKPDEVAYVGNGSDKAQVGIELHSGKNRVVRRIFERFEYKVKKLDRVMFGPLTKKDLPRGRWRLLTDAEVGMLKMISSKE